VTATVGVTRIAVKLQLSAIRAGRGHTLEDDRLVSTVTILANATRDFVTIGYVEPRVNRAQTQTSLHATGTSMGVTTIAGVPTVGIVTLRLVNRTVVENPNILDSVTGVSSVPTLINAHMAINHTFQRSKN
jgi:hypothetical protein